MKYPFLLLCIPLLSFSQFNFKYTPTQENPFGTLNPDAPNRMDGFKWIGDWVNTSETIMIPTWKIDSVKRKTISEVEMIKKIEND